MIDTSPAINNGLSPMSSRSFKGDNSPQGLCLKFRFIFCSLKLILIFNCIVKDMRTLNNISRRSDTFKAAAKKQLATLTHSPSKLSVQDMIKSSKKSNDTFGIEGNIFIVLKA